MAELKLKPELKYSTLLCCQVRDILSIYIPARSSFSSWTSSTCLGLESAPEKLSNKNDIEYIYFENRKKLSFTVGEQINEDNNKYALFEESFSIGFM